MEHNNVLTDLMKTRKSVHKVSIVLITGFLTRLTRRVPLVEQKLLILLEHISSPPVFGGFVLLDL